jgi:hypothetical protein
MGWGGAMLALSAVQAVGQIGQGKVAQAEANYNATLVQGKADMIGVSAEIQKGQDKRAAGLQLSSDISTVAGMGLMPSGSVMAHILDTQTQMEINQAITQFNYKQEQNATVAQAGEISRSGKLAVQTARADAFSTMLKGASNYAMYNYKDTTFDSVNKGQA